MSTGYSSGRKSQGSTARHGNDSPMPPQPTSTPDLNTEFQPCTATASFLLYAQRNIILCLHHDTLAIERRFDRHREEVLWICADTVSERGAGRLAVSYDAGHTAIVWDISTGDEIARFAAYEHIRVAAWMKNGNIAFGNSQGNMILFEPSTSEHISARTIYDPITAIAPSPDCRTFAIGFLNGSILIATLQPLFTIVHSLTTSKAPSRIAGLAWHGSSSRQKSDMLATQTADGDLRVWSIPKAMGGGDAPNIIRILHKPESGGYGPCWFAWSKNGRIIQHADGETHSWDVRTKNVSHVTVPTVDAITGIACYGPSSTLFTLGANHTVQQYDVNPSQTPMQVASVQHAPGPMPPSPPNSIEEQRKEETSRRLAAEAVEAAETAEAAVPLTFAYLGSDAHEGELGTMSPLEKIAKEMDQLDDQRQDRLGALSPTSSRASSTSSRSSQGSHRVPSYRYDKAPSSRASNLSHNEGTEFSFGIPSKPPRESVSIRSTSSFRASGLRKEILRSPEEAQRTSQMDLFPCTRERLRNVPFRTPHYGQFARTPDILRREMLSVVFGWNDDIELLVRDELSRQKPGSASGVLLSKWLGEFGADAMASMIGSESMTSSDWMLLALSSMGPSSQKQVGQAFVQRLLEKGDVHPAVAVLLGLGEHLDAIEVYVSRSYHMEAILLTCLTMPSEWQRQSYLVRKWGEASVMKGQPELAVRCFSCTSIETTEPWYSPRAQDAIFPTQQEQSINPSPLSPPLSPPLAAGPSRKITRNGSLKLITTFGDKGVPLVLPSDQRTPMAGMLGVGVTPIAESAISPGGVAPWLLNNQRIERDPSSARTATPGAYQRKRLPSKSGTSRTRTPSQTPLTARRDISHPLQAPESLDAQSSVHSRKTSSASSNGKFGSIDGLSRKSSHSDRLPSPNQDAFARLKDPASQRNGSRDRTHGDLHVQVFETAYLAPQALHHSSLNENRQDKHEYGYRNADVDKNNALESRGRPSKRFINAPRRSPSSPIPMSPDEVLASRANAVAEDESYYRSPITPVSSRKDSIAGQLAQASSRAASRQRTIGQTNPSVKAGTRNRSQQRQAGAQLATTLSLPSITSQDVRLTQDAMQAHEQRLRTASATRAPENSQAQRELDVPRSDLDGDSSASENPEQGSLRRRELQGLAKKQIAARELEERRASLARRPSAPTIPQPSELSIPPRRPVMAPRHHTELGNTPNSVGAPLSGAFVTRSRTTEPDDTNRHFNKTTGTSTPSAPIGLPATPRAMRHPRYMNIDPHERETIPSIPPMPTTPPRFTSPVPSNVSPQSQGSEEDQIAPLLPSTVFGQTVPQSPPRASSAPPESNNDGTSWQHKSGLPSFMRRASFGRGHSRKNTPTDNQVANLQPQHSPSSTRASIDQTIHEEHVIVVGGDEETATLPELQHLAGPPPPPPPPMALPNATTSVGTINIAIDDEAPMIIDVVPTIDRAGSMTAPPSNNIATQQPVHHRRGRGSISEGFGSRFRSVADRMRNNSKSRAKSPPVDVSAPSPYETVLPPLFTRQQQGDVNRVKSPYESASATNSDASLSYALPPPPPPPPAPPSTQSSLKEQVVPPDNTSGKSSRVYPHPKEVRANFASETLSQGVYKPDNMI